MACKPDSVIPLDDHSSERRIAPAPLAANPNPWAKAALRWYRQNDHPATGFLFGIAPGGACHAGFVTKTPVGSYPTLSPLPEL